MAASLLEKAKSVSEPQFLQNLGDFPSNYVPPEPERQLEFLDFNEEGHMLLGCSNLTGRFWIGSLWYYQDPSEAPSVEKALTGLDCDNGVVEGFFVRPRDFLVALDNGSIELLTLSHNRENPSEPYNFLERKKSIREHDDIITGMTMTADGSKIVTSSYDKSIVILEQNHLGVDQRKIDAHADLVSHVSANQQNTNVIATCGNDGKVITWDIRNMTDSSGCVYDDPSVWPTCLAWTPNSEHHLVVGNQTGSIQVFDVRRSNEPVVCDKSISKQIYRMKFSPKRSNLFSVSADNVSLHVFDLDPQFSSLTVKYCDKRHDDFIRGLAWHPQTDALYTCGWDHKVLSHSF